MSHSIHKPLPKFYKSDINDLVEDLVKGGPGSGKKGHRTATTMGQGKYKAIPVKDLQEMSDQDLFHHFQKMRYRREQSRIGRKPSMMRQNMIRKDSERFDAELKRRGFKDIHDFANKKNFQF